MMYHGPSSPTLSINLLKVKQCWLQVVNGKLQVEVMHKSREKPLHIFVCKMVTPKLFMTQLVEAIPSQSHPVYTVGQWMAGR